MGRKAILLGKLSPPETSGSLVRERLLRQLDEAFKGNLIWISAQAGAGKTTLLASWIQSRKLPAVWYQFDEGDEDLASFFLNLNLAVGPRRRLPRLSPEHLMAPDHFARRYFEKLFKNWSTHHVLVFENYQMLAPDSPLHSLLDIALDLMPRGCVMAVASRQSAPAPLSRRFAYGSTISLTWEDVRFTEAESLDLARLWKVNGGQADLLYAACDGWAAMQVLLMRLGVDVSSQPNPAGTDLVADYLDGALFSQLPAREQTFLRAIALPPFVTGELAQQLTGVDEATSILDRLTREHLLVTRSVSTAGERRYQFHPILRDFLLLRLTRDISPEDVKQLRIRGAQLLEERGESESAVDLLIGASAWSEVGRLICSHAASLMDSGRMRVLGSWLAAMPECEREASPWLLFWQGALLRLADPSTSRLFQEKAFHGFMAEGCADGSYLAWAAIVESYAAPWSNFRELRPWLGELEDLRRRYGEPVDPKVALPVLNAGLTTFIGEPYNPFFSECLARAKILIGGSLPTPQAGALAWPIALQASWSGVGVEGAKALVARVSFTHEQALAHPMGYVFHVIGRIYLEATSLNPEGARDWVRRGLEVANATGVHLFDYAIRAGEAYAATIDGDHAAARDALEKMRPMVNPGALLDHHQVQYLDAGIRLMAGDAAGALRVLGNMPEQAAEMGAIGPTRFAELLRAQALALDGQGQAARSMLVGPRDLAEHLPSPITAFQADLVEAHTWFAEGDEEQGRAVLERAMGIGRHLDAMAMTPFWLEKLMAPLCRRALEADIEVGYVRRMVRARGLLPDSPNVENWPWPIRVYTLGRFQLLIDDVPLTFSGKAQKRPLALLKVLVALGGRSVATAAAIEAVWEGDSKDESRHNLDVAVSRLRKLLGSEKVVSVQEGKLSLNDKMVWVDTWAFERLAAEWETAPDERRPALARQAMVRYAGPFLAGEEVGPSSLVRRERLRSRYLRLVSGEGKALERDGQWTSAADVYRRALELEPLAEELYQAQMRCHLELGEHAQALDVFRRCRQMLSIVLGVTPSSVSEALAQRCYQQ